MKIYTKGGDQGQTSLFGGKRVSKSALRIQTYGLADELNCTLGLVLACKKLPVALRKNLSRIQNELFVLGSELATPSTTPSPLLTLDEGSVIRLENEIDQMEKSLPKLKNFILPGGSIEGAFLHQARTHCRRFECSLIKLHESEGPLRETVLKYVNRLSDYLFVSARFCNLKNKVRETAWLAPKKL